MNYVRIGMLFIAIIPFVMFHSYATSVTMNKCVHKDGRVEFTDRQCQSDASSSSVKSNITAQINHSQVNNVTKTSPSHLEKHTEGIPKVLAQQNSQPIQPAVKGGLPAEDRLKSCDANIAITAAQEIVNNPATLKEPMNLFSAAFAFFQNGRKDEGVFWFYAAQLRTKLQLIVENGDRGQIMTIMQMTMGEPINNYALQNTSNLIQILDRMLVWDKKTANPYIDIAKSHKLDNKIDQIYAGFNDLKTRIVKEKTTLESAARQAAPGIQQSLDMMNKQRCVKGKPDPSYENQIRKEEERLALDFITHNDHVIKLAGGLHRVFPSSSISYKNDRNKGRYDFSIKGTKSFNAIVDVNRSTGKPVFSLACLTTLSMGQREAGKEACTQSIIPLPK